MKIREHGIQLREKSRVYTSRPRCDSDGKNFGSVRLIDCYIVLLILLYGFIASIIIFGIEIATKSKLKKMCTQKMIACKECGENSNAELSD